MVLKQRVSPTRGGTGGSGGSGGHGGSGGMGGPGGSSYSWSETTYYTDSNGNRQSVPIFFFLIFVFNNSNRIQHGTLILGE